jgi:DNA-binding response OmpR family regulator
MSKKKILIVSGDPVLMDLLQKNLSIGGFQVVGVEETDREVESMLSIGQPDLVIVDIMMPKMEGFKVTLRIRKKFDVPVIMLTSRMAEKDKVRGLDLSSDDCLSRSVDVVQLMDWIKETFARNATMPYYHSEPDNSGNRQN